MHGSTVHTCMRARRDRAFVKDRTYARHTTIRRAYDTECLPLAIDELAVNGIHCHATIDRTACVPLARRDRAVAEDRSYARHTTIRRAYDTERLPLAIRKLVIDGIRCHATIDRIACVPLARRDRAVAEDRSYARHTTIRRAYDTERLPLAIRKLVIDGIRCHATIDRIACVPLARRDRAFVKDRSYARPTTLRRAYDTERLPLAIRKLVVDGIRCHATKDHTERVPLARRDRAFTEDRSYARYTTIRRAYDTECLPPAIHKLVVDGIGCHATKDHTACVLPARWDRAFAKDRTYARHTITRRAYNTECLPLSNQRALRQWHTLLYDHSQRMRISYIPDGSCIRLPYGIDYAYDAKCTPSTTNERATTGIPYHVVGGPHRTLACVP